MNFKRYQEKASRTLPKQEMDQPKSDILKNMCFGLTGETGEFIDYMKKVFWHGHELEKNKVIDELGDVLWYIAGICSTLDIDLISVPMHNIDKLRERYPDGFEESRSVNREDSEIKNQLSLPLALEKNETVAEEPPKASNFVKKLLNKNDEEFFS